MDTAERELFTAALRQAAASPAFEQGLEDMGWADALADDRRTAVATLFEIQGDHDVTSTALDTVIATALGLDKLGLDGRIVLPAVGGHAAPGTVDGNRLCVRGVCRGTPAGDVIAVTAAGYQVLQDVRMRPIAGMAPSLDLVEVSADVALDIAGPADWSAGVAAAHLALAHELVGTSRAMLRLGREHALEREQFGRPIASFQAVRHRLAEALIAVEAAQAAADAAWLAPGTEILAKAVAGRSARIVARHAQQVLAGMGFTTEHPFHRYLRRALLLDGLFGSSRTLARDVATEVLRTKRLPQPIPL